MGGRSGRVRGFRRISELACEKRNPPSVPHVHHVMILIIIK